MNATSTLDGDSIQCSYNGPLFFSPGSFSVGPFSSDGPVVIAVQCSDVYGAGASASITVNVLPPASPPSDLFTIAGGDPYTLTWTVYSTPNGCFVQQTNMYGNVVWLAQGGGTSGSATTSFLSPSLAPYSFQLYCGGALDTNVPGLGADP